MIGIRYRENVTIGTRLNASAWHAKITVPFGPPQTNLTQYSVLYGIQFDSTVRRCHTLMANSSNNGMQHVY